MPRRTAVTTAFVGGLPTQGDPQDEGTPGVYTWQGVRYDDDLSGDLNVTGRVSASDHEDFMTYVAQANGGGHAAFDTWLGVNDATYKFFTEDPYTTGGVSPSFSVSGETIYARPLSWYSTATGLSAGTGAAWLLWRSVNPYGHVWLVTANWSGFLDGVSMSNLCWIIEWNDESSASGRADKSLDKFWFNTVYTSGHGLGHAMSSTVLEGAEVLRTSDVLDVSNVGGGGNTFSATGRSIVDAFLESSPAFGSAITKLKFEIGGVSGNVRVFAHQIDVPFMTGRTPNYASFYWYALPSSLNSSSEISSGLGVTTAQYARSAF